MTLLIYDCFAAADVFAFTTQTVGGVSDGQYNSFNLGKYSGDSTENIEQNFEILAKEINISKQNIFIPYQTHDDKIVAIDSAFLSLSKEEQSEKLEGVDALISNQQGICIGVTTADCVPILLYDPTHHAIVAIHAGWKSTVKAIVSKTIEKMSDTYHTRAKDLQVVIGPCISQQAFEVGHEVLSEFVNNHFHTEAFTCIDPITGKPHIDLRKANIQLLLRAGIDSKNIHINQTCTYTSSLYFSARRQGFASGRMLSAIYLK